MRVSKADAVRNFLRLPISASSSIVARETVRSIRQLGRTPPGTTTTNDSRNFSRGLWYLLNRKNFMHVVRTLRNLVLYSTDPKYFEASELYAEHLKDVGKLIKEGPLQRQNLKIFDAGCNRGYLVEYILQPIERYIGMDLFEDIMITAKVRAPERFEQIGCSDYRFTQGDILDRDAYSELPKDNNVAVCTGVAGHFRPSEIIVLLENLSSILCNDENARIYLGFPVTNGRKEWTTTWTKDTVEGIDCWQKRSNYCDPYSFRCYNPDQLMAFIRNNGFEIDIENSDLESDRCLKSLHLCIKKTLVT
ncbi:MAG: class I SAM-dependent methyltransferase [Candidatus Melainabacteria bacterium]|nr:class I SAM-dependent methyltransferase [Candidatus Melainabacteria bacterium]MBI3308878.1 class I SAM-dependent methyltransferase [Candidatus Melainabacteria bacterium]